MKLPLRALALALAAPVGVAAYVGCSSETTPAADDAGGTTPTNTVPTSPTTPPTNTTRPDSSPPPGDASPPPGDASPPPGDASPPPDGGCTYVKPVMDGGGACGTYEFGAAAATFVMTDAGPGDGYDGGTIPPGIYDAIVAERGSASGGAWRETLVLDGTRFLRTRQITTTADASPGALTRRSGRYTTTGNQIRFEYDCAVADGTAIDAGSDTLPFDTNGAGCTPNVRYGVTGIRITLKRRP